MIVLSPLLLALAGVACALGAARVRPGLRIGLLGLAAALALVGVGRPSPMLLWAPLLLALPGLRYRGFCAVAGALLVGSSVLSERWVFETPACLAVPEVAQLPASAPDLPWARPEGFQALHRGEITGPIPDASPKQIAVHDGVAALPGCLPPGQLRVTAPATGELEIVAGRGAAIDDDDRKMRRLVLPVEAGAAVVADLGEVLLGGWDSGGELCALEVSGGVSEVEIVDSEAAWKEVAASYGRIELGGVVRPSWVLNQDAVVRIQIVLDSPRTLRWTEGGTAASERRVVVNGESFSASGAGWGETRSVLVEGAVDIELHSAGAGLGVFGDLGLWAPPRDAPDVLFVLVDTLRADHLSQAPSWQRLADEGLRFAFTNSASPWTKPSMPTLMSGVWPTRHRVGAEAITDRVPDSLPLIQQRFRDAGWATASFSASPLASTLSGLDRGFGAAYAPRHWGVDREHGKTPSDAEVYDSALAWWGAQDRPAYLYVHLLDVHQYYVEGGRTHAPYLDAIAAADAEFERFFEAARAAGLLDDTLVVLTSDHGEAFQDHGAISHGTGLSQSQLQVPLVFWHPERLEPGLRTELVALADVAPTLAALFDLDPLADADGRSLAELLGPGALDPRAAPAALMRFTWAPDAPQQRALVAADGRKLWDRGTDRWAFDLVEDPCETWRRGRSEHEQDRFVEWLQDEAPSAASYQQVHRRESGGLAPFEASMLKELGYLE